ncbi:MAG: GntR family transcriptional regulator [Anaerolineae bacterium]
MVEYHVDPEDPLPLYYQVYLSLQSRVHKGEFKPGDALPSERQLAKDYGVSRITIIKAKDLLERDKLIEHQQGRGSFVLDRGEAACEVPSSRVAFCLPTYADSYITEILIGAARVALRENIQLEIVGLERGDHEASRVRKAIDSGVEGLLLLPRARYPDVELFRKLRSDGYPLILFDRYYPELDTDWVTFDDEGAGYELTKHLIRKGHRKISVFTGHEVEVTSVRGRIRGYQRALEAAGLPYDENSVCLDVYDELSPTSVYNLQSTYRRLLDRLRSDGFTAIIAINRYVALQLSMDLMRIRAYLTQLAPDDPAKTKLDELGLAIAAISNKPFTHEETALTALAIQSGELLGERAMELVLRRLREGASLASQHVAIPMEVVTID